MRGFAPPTLIAILSLLMSCDSISIDQLLADWPNELATNYSTGVGEIRESVLRRLRQDAIDGLLDNSGPLRNGRRLGVQVINPAGYAQFVEARTLCGLFR
jgi:hypothetical protein